MTEAEWLAATDPMPMLDVLEGKTSHRKLLLFSLACCRRLEQFIPDWPCAGLVNVLERHADGCVPPESLPERIFSGWVGSDPYTLACGPHLFDFADAVLEAAFDRTPEEPAPEFMSIGRGPGSVIIHMNWALSALGREVPDPKSTLVPNLHDIFGNPFRPVAFAPDWRAPTTVTLATQMYESRDFSAIPILADALQDAGCDNDDILNHCRDANQVHVRGCWVVDLVLGRE